MAVSETLRAAIRAALHNGVTSYAFAKGGSCRSFGAESLRSRRPRRKAVGLRRVGRSPEARIAAEEAASRSVKSHCAREIGGGFVANKRLTTTEKCNG